MKPKTLLYFLITLCTHNICLAQNAISPEAEKSIIKDLNEASLKMPSQSIYIQTDKDIYELGEDLWFKGYMIDAQTKNLDDRSYMLFVQLLESASQEVVVEERFEIQNGIASGHIFIPEEWEEGNYMLTAHTKYSLLKSSTEITSFKPISFKKSIVPKIITHVHFDKKDYQIEDTIRCTLEVYSPRGRPIENARVKILGMQGDKKEKVWRENTNSDGVISIEILPTSRRFYSSLDVSVSHDDNEENLTYIIPRVSNRALQFDFFPEGGHLVAGMMNNVAFKAVDEVGLPVAVEGSIYEGSVAVVNFSSEHNGMGMVSFKPQLGVDYSIALNAPATDSIYYLPDIKLEGMVLRTEESRGGKMRFALEKSQNFQMEDIYVRAQSRGIVHWLARGSFNGEMMNFSIPTEKLLPGIVEITVFDENFKPIVERLIYAHLDKNLGLELINDEDVSFNRREKISLQLRVSDYENKAASPHLGVRIYSTRYSDSINSANILTHQYLKTDIKGHIYNPKYYFQKENLLRQKHLNLLLMTQGWRSYKWNQKELTEIQSIDLKGSLQEDLLGNFYHRSSEGLLEPAGRTVVNVASSNGIIPVVTNIKGAFNLSKSIFKQTQGYTFILKPEKKGVLKFENPFETINKIRIASAFNYEGNKTYLGNEKIKFLDNPFGFDKVNALQEVVLTGYKDGRRNKGSKFNSEYEFRLTDYVCLYDILNCVNHSSGKQPIDGYVYRTNSGSSVTYRRPFPEGKEELKSSEDFVALKGFYPDKSFYSPNYDKPDDFYVPDYRKTLLWAPQVVPDKNGEFELQFYASDVSSTYIVEIEGIDEKGRMGVFYSNIKVHN